MEFEYNQTKSRINLEKRGISFEEAKSLWSAPAVEIEGRSEGEPRRIVIGKMREKFYSCIFTVRQNKIRLISARRSHRNEENIYREVFHEKENIG